MATVVGVMTALGGGAIRVTWPSMGSGDDGTFVSGLSRFKNKTVRVTGSAVTAVHIEGPDGAGAGHILNDSRGEGNAMTFAAADTRELLENTDSVRPRVQTGTAVVVVLEAMH